MRDIAAIVAEHPAHEGVDHLQRRDVDQHCPGARGDDSLREVILQRQRQLVVHVDLDRHQQEVPRA
jgi:hypothetical protein